MVYKSYQCPMKLGEHVQFPNYLITKVGWFIVIRFIKVTNFQLPNCYKSQIIVLILWKLV